MNIPIFIRCGLSGLLHRRGSPLVVVNHIVSSMPYRFVALALDRSVLHLPLLLLYPLHSRFRLPLLLRLIFGLLRRSSRSLVVQLAILLPQFGFPVFALPTASADAVRGQS